ncbi:MAG: hypothetical protein AAGA66_07295 [Bacteroidota bacterium]
MNDIVILTDERYVDPVEKNEYVNNALLEDELVLSSMIKNGLKAKKVAWSDPNFNWRSTRYALFRSTWDYTKQLDKFICWLDEASKQTTFINAYGLVSYNLDKHYLNDLKRAGVHVVVSYFIEQGDTRTLKALHEELGWANTVLKPCISASARGTFQLTRDSLDPFESEYRRLVNKESMMLQPFQRSVVERGEVSLMMIGGEYTHAVLKVAKQGDFRVQDDFGGTVHEYQPTEEEKELAIKAINACDEMPVYARVDLIKDNDGKVAVSELELIEPEMWFRKQPEAARKLADFIRSKFF